MKQFTQNKKGIAPLFIILFVVGVLVIGGAGYYLFFFQKHASSSETISNRNANQKGSTNSQTTSGKNKANTQNDQSVVQVPKIDLNLLTTKLATISSEYQLISWPNVDVELNRAIWFSPNGRQVIYRVKHNEKTFFVINGKKSKDYVWIFDPLFSSDGKQLVYKAVLDGQSGSRKQTVVFNENEGKLYDSFLSEHRFSYDGAKLAYVAQDGIKEFVVLDGQEVNDYDKSYGPLFSSHGPGIVFIAEKDSKKFVVFNGETQKKYDGSILNLTISPNGKRIAYKVEKYIPETDKIKDFIVLDGKDGQDDSSMFIPDLFFSPDSQKLVQLVNKDVINEKEFNIMFTVILDDKESKWYDMVLSDSLKFSNDSTQLAYIAEENNKSFIVINNKESIESLNKIRDFSLSSDGQQIAHREIVKDNIESGSEKEIIVANGRRHKIYSEVSSPKFGSDSKIIVYREKKIEQWFIVLNEKEGKAYDYVWDPIFSHDNKYITYGAKKGNELWWVVEEVDKFGMTDPTTEPQILTNMDETNASSSDIDSDNDGLTDTQEVQYKTDQKNPDTDGDGFKDGDEVNNGYNPNGSGKL